MPEFKTKMFNEILRNLIKQESKKTTKQSVLVVNDAKDERVKYSAENLAGVKSINLNNINIVDLLKYKNIILTVRAVEKLEERYK